MSLHLCDCDDGLAVCANLKAPSFSREPTYPGSVALPARKLLEFVGAEEHHRVSYSKIGPDGVIR